MSDKKFALYREWRPRKFDDVVGQDLIVSALQESILNNDIAHAYLFCGTRGTGKTSLAKIFSRAVNCPNLDAYANPCNECECCQSILESTVLDVVEMDAASNNSVEDIRRIIEEVSYRPVIAKYKVYIIDEAHMLSTAAFNALLKTLEEPPKHVIFILATTDPQRLPATIHSRCQRYDFRRISKTDMSDHLRRIADDINLSITDDAISAIVSMSDGAMRDAISLLDQCRSIYDGKKRIMQGALTSSKSAKASSASSSVSSLDDNNLASASITEENSDYEVNRNDILEITGKVSDHLILSLMTALCKGSALMLNQVLDQVSTKGMDYSRFCLDLAIYFRHLLLLKCGGKVVISSLPLPTDTALTLSKYLKFYSQSSLINIIQKLSELSFNLRSSNEARLSFELGLISIMQESILARQSLLDNKKKITEEHGSAFPHYNSEEAKVGTEDNNDAKADNGTVEKKSYNSVSPTNANTDYVVAANASDNALANADKVNKSTYREADKRIVVETADKPFLPDYKRTEHLPLIPDDKAAERRLQKDLREKNFAKSYASKIPPKVEIPSYDLEPSGFNHRAIFKDQKKNEEFFKGVNENKEVANSASIIDEQTGEEFFPEVRGFNEDDFDNTAIPKDSIEETVHMPYGLGLTQEEKLLAKREKPKFAPLHRVWPEKFKAEYKPKPNRAEIVPGEVIKAHWHKVLNYFSKTGNLALKLIAQSRKYIFEENKVTICFDPSERLLFEKFNESETRLLFAKGISLAYPNAKIELCMLFDEKKELDKEKIEYHLDWVRKVRELCEESGVDFSIS